VEQAASKLFGASIALLAGYVWFRVSYRRRFAVEHLRTDRFAIYLVGISVVLYVLGDFLAHILPDLMPDCPVLMRVREDARLAGITEAVINAVILAILWGVAENCHVLRKMARNRSLTQALDALPFKKKLRLAAIADYINRSSDSNVRTLFRAQILRKRIMITLKSMKVYVGEPDWPNFDPAHSLASIKIRLFASGSRNKDTKKVSLSTSYVALDSALRPAEDTGPLADGMIPLRVDTFLLDIPGTAEPAKIDIEDLGTVISWSEIESISIFDPNIYAWFQSQAPAEK
jgi:hypothetical protein